MALVLRLTRTDSTARPVAGQGEPHEAAKRRVMAKETIRNASVFRPVRRRRNGLVPVGRLEGKASSDGPTCPQAGCYRLTSGQWDCVCGGIEDRP